MFSQVVGNNANRKYWRKKQALIGVMFEWRENGKEFIWFTVIDYNEEKKSLSRSKLSLFASWLHRCRIKRLKCFLWLCTREFIRWRVHGDQRGEDIDRRRVLCDVSVEEQVLYRSLPTSGSMRLLSANKETVFDPNGAFSPRRTFRKKLTAEIRHWFKYMPISDSSRQISTCCILGTCAYFSGVLDQLQSLVGC